MNPDDPRHGTYAGGRVHRRDGEDVCEPCRRAEARYEQERQLDVLEGRPRMVPSLGPRRRIQALVALGHSFARIAEALEVSQAAANFLAHRPAELMRATTAAKISALYDAWSMTLPPTNTTRDRHGATYARTVARRHGWVPPLAWDDIDHDPAPVTTTSSRTGIDDVAIQRRMAGDRTIRLTTAEAIELVHRWQTTGRPLNECERTTGLPPWRYLDRPREDVA